MTTFMIEKKNNHKARRFLELNQIQRLWRQLPAGKRAAAGAAGQGKWFRIFLLVVFSLLAAIIVYPRSQVSYPDYRVNDIAQANIKATADFLVEDQESTAKRQQECITESPLVYDLDERVGAEINARLHDAFEFMRQARQEALQEATSHRGGPGAAITSPPFSQVYKIILDKKPEFERRLGVVLPNNIFYLLARDNFSVQWEDIISQQVNFVVSQGVFSEQSSGLQNQRRHIIIRHLPSWNEKVENNPERFLPVEEARKKVGLYCRETVTLPTGSRYAVCEVAQSLVVPNLALNRAETERRKLKRLQELRPVYFQIKQGEMLVREGEKITPTHLIKLQAMKKETPQGWWLWKFLGSFFIIVLLFGACYQLSRLFAKKSSHNNTELTFLALILLSVTLLNLGLTIFGDALTRLSPLISKNFIFYLPVALAPILANVFIGLEVAVMISFLASILTAMLLENPFLFCIYFSVSNLVGVWGTRYCRNRWVLIRAGLSVAVVNFAMVLAIKLLDLPLDLEDVFFGGVFALGGGIQVGILASGLAPILEMLFDLTSDIKLLELLNLERPMLRQLMLAAPGTYHHSIIVGNMVEAAAEKIGANPLLAKAAAYYHDIGKIKKPTYFVENQLGGENKHEKLAPSMSSLILQAHVKDGMELARQDRVGQKIIDIIQQHHGTSFMAYFFNKAKQQAANPQQVNIEDYRYPGPRPQTKEAGLVLLADQVEAASKTLLDPTPARIQGLVQKIINNIFADGQLDECELTLKDLHEIAKSFIKILSGIFHHRVDYPQAADKGGEKKKSSDDLDKQPAEKDSLKPHKDQEKGREDLKRLGLS